MTEFSQLSEISDELKAHWDKWLDLVDPDCCFGSQVAAILADREDDKLGRIHDMQDGYAERCARYAIESGIWYGMWGDLKRAAGINEPSPFDDQHQLKEAA